VSAFVLVGENLADVVQQRAPTRHGYVEPKLRRHDPRQPRHFLGVIQNVLTVTRAPTHTPNQLYELRMQAMNAAFVGGLFTCLDDRRVDFQARLVHNLLDAARMDAAIGYQLLE